MSNENKNSKNTGVKSERIRVHDGRVVNIVEQKQSPNPPPVPPAQPKK